MWTCPKCGRTFKKINQGHYCGKAPETIEEYICQQSQEVQPYLFQIRLNLRLALPEAQEKIAWSMPTFWQGFHVIQFAAFKKHVSLYPGIEAVEAFREELRPYRTNKGTIQLPYQDPLPLALIAKIAQWCLLSGSQP